MNKLVIVGNGFDIAHGLKTKYSDFVDWKICSAIRNLKDIIPKLNGSGLRYNETLNYEYVRFKILSSNMLFNGENPLLSVIEKLSNSKTYNEVKEILKELSGHNSYYKIEIDFTNNLFNYCVAHFMDKNWVDVEAIYYKLLKEYTSQLKANPAQTSDIIKLNIELEEIKKDLEEYLISHNANHNFNLSTYFKDKDSLHDTYHFEEEEQSSYFQNLVLNFNYTNTAKLYSNNSDIINIHGQLKNSENPIIFGYGDEYDDYYSEIEKIDDNKLLKNIKSIAYLDTRNYSRLLNYIESHNFYVYIMGHSCGLSDKTLLNTIFEHPHCKYIRVFYHEYSDNSKNKINNYKDIVSNISRVFKDKPLMRKKVVNFMDCEPLPQHY